LKTVTVIFFFEQQRPQNDGGRPACAPQYRPIVTTLDTHNLYLSNDHKDTVFTYPTRQRRFQTQTLSTMRIRDYNIIMLLDFIDRRDCIGLVKHIGYTLKLITWMTSWGYRCATNPLNTEWYLIIIRMIRSRVFNTKYHWFPHSNHDYLKFE